MFPENPSIDVARPNARPLRLPRRAVLRCVLASLVAIAASVAPRAGHAAESTTEDSIVVASTTSTQDSGFFSYLLPRFRERTGIVVKVVALGTGQALDTARRGDADVVFVHDPEAERQFVAEGHGLQRRPVMYNDFVLVGPAADPARAGQGRDVLQALRAIAANRGTFISRGDRSGTHQAELRLWQAAGVTVEPSGSGWYRSAGQGMGPVLNMAAASGGYTLVDRATWLTFRNKADLTIRVEGDPRLANQYSLILVNPAKHPGLNAVAGQRFIDYLLSPEGQALIAEFRVAGEQLYHPNAGEPERLPR